MSKQNPPYSYSAIDNQIRALAMTLAECDIRLSTIVVVSPDDYARFERLFTSDLFGPTTVEIAEGRLRWNSLITVTHNGMLRRVEAEPD